MRIKLSFGVTESFYLPISHNEILQGFIYHHFDRVLAKYIHNIGFNYEKRKFRLFTFSRITGGVRYDSRKKAFFINSKFNLIVSSPKVEIMESLATVLVNTPELSLGGNKIILDSIDVYMQKDNLSDNCIIRMLSPVTVYSTLMTGDGKSKTYYYNPKEADFGELIKKNLQKKYELLYEKVAPEDDFKINLLRFDKNKEKIIKYKDYIIKGWMGDFELRANPELILVGYDAGLGAKNSQGFGCFEIIKERGGVYD